MSAQKRHGDLPPRKHREKYTKLRDSIARTVAGNARHCRNHPKTTASLATAAVAAVGAVALLAGHQPRSAPAVDPRTHVTVDYTACLLTGASGINSQPASAAWEGMQTATSITNERVANQSVIGAQTLQNATSFINTLAAQKCAVILAVSQPVVEAAEAEASTYPAIHFIAIASTILPKQAPDNIIRISAAGDHTVTQQVIAALTADFRK
jgi:basic membrane lipoprotein Med (substrate-binding protein (PBP1-ABC) superfamily)